MNIKDEFAYIDDYFDHISAEQLFKELLECGLQACKHPGREWIDKNVYKNCPLKDNVENLKYVKLIHDVDELKWFFDNIIPQLKPTEVIFLSLSARNKYLTDKEKVSLELGRTEMFAKTIVREKEWERFLRTIRKLECDERGYTTKNNSPIPSKAIVCYININPSDTLKALNEFNKVINEYMFELSQVAVNKRDPENIFNRLNKVDNNLMTAYQQSTGTRLWIDFDLDIDKNWKVYEEVVFKDWMKKKGILTYFWIDTKSGYHLLISREDLRFNPKELVDFIKQGYCNWLFNEYDYEMAQEKLDSCEIIKNDNAMIPVPGCLQGGYPVKVLNKEVK